MKLERRAMEKRVAYIEHFLTMSEDEKKVRTDLRSGKRKGKAQEDEIVEEEAVGQDPPPALPRQPTAPALPPPKAPPMQSIPEPTPIAARALSRVPTEPTEPPAGGAVPDGTDGVPS